jgi:hypothetical protein
MKKITAKPINTNSWILQEWGNRVGVLSLTEKWNVLDKTGQHSYSSLEELQSLNEWRIDFETGDESSEPAVDKIGIFPIKHTLPQSIEMEPIVSYTKTTKSLIRFAAGYWGIRFDHGWTAVFCPKVETVLNNETAGPFTSKIETSSVVKQQNNKSKKAGIG